MSWIMFTTKNLENTAVEAKWTCILMVSLTCNFGKISDVIEISYAKVR